MLGKESGSPTCREGWLKHDTTVTLCSAHCLRFGELWYNAYNIGPTETAFWIDVDLLRYLDKEAKYEVWIGWHLHTHPRLSLLMMPFTRVKKKK